MERRVVGRQIENQSDIGVRHMSGIVGIVDNLQQVATFGLIPAAKKERVLPPSFTFNGKPYQWTRALPEEVRVPLFEAFTGGQSVKGFIATPKDAVRCAATIARLEKETGAVYAEAWLEELAVSRAQVEEQAAKLVV